MISLSVVLQVTDTLNKLKLDETVTRHISFFDLLIKGGVILVPIGILSLIAIYLIAEKYYVIHMGTRVRRGVSYEFKKHLRTGDTEMAKSLLKKETGAYSTIFLHGLDHLDYPVKEMESEMENVSNIEVNKLTKNLNYLGIIAGIAPMLGFIGTISGIIKIFYNISITDNISIGVISGGLYEKMISSGSGLIVGVIAYAGYHVLNMKLDRFISFVEAEAFDVVNIIKSRNRQ